MTPQLRFPEFADAWQAKRLGDYLSSISSGKSKTITDGRAYAIYGSTGKIGESDSFDYSGDKLLIARVGANAGTMHRVNGQYKVSDNTLILELTTCLSTSFVQYLLVKTDLSRLVFGSGQPLVTGGQLKKLKVSIPTKPEQEKIADFLTTVDERIAVGERQCEQLARYKRGVMQQIFSKKIRFKNSDGNNYPDWQEKPLSEISKRVTVRNKNNEVSFVLTNSATAGVVSQTDYFDKSIANANNLTNYYIVEKGDFVYNPRISAHAPVGPIKRNNLSTGVMSPLYSVFNITDGNSIFYEQYFETNYWHDYMRSIANYGARHDRMNISTADLYDMPLPFPVPQEQQKIADFLTTLDDRITATKTTLTAAKQFKKALSQRMFV